MKKQLIAILSIMLIIAFGIILTVKAADYALPSNATVTLKSDKTEVNPGDTFVITVSGSCADGINGLNGYLNYNANELEFVSKESANNEKFSVLPGNEAEGKFEIAIIGSSANVKEGDIEKITFKVKDSVERGTIIKVTPSDIMLDSFAETDSEHNDTGVNVVSIKVKEKETAKPDNTTKPSTDNTTPEDKKTQNSADNKTEYKNIENKNATQSQAKTMPYTGTNMFIIMSVVAVGIVAIVSYVAYKRYKNI